MRIKRSKVEKITVLNPEFKAEKRVWKLDTINAFFEDYREGCGKITIEVFGEAWAYAWMGLGDEKMTPFFLSTETDYLMRKFARGPVRVTDWDEVSNKIGSSCFSEFESLEHEDDLTKAYGEDWCYHLPKTYSSEAQSLTRIITALKQALNNDTPQTPNPEPTTP